METPYKIYMTPPDSPSRQLLWELGRLQITSQEAFYARLDRENSEREEAHRFALSVAAAEHARIRRDAEIEYEKLQLQIQATRERRERDERKALENQRLELEKQRREKEVEEKRREIERVQTMEAALKRMVEARKAADAAEQGACLTKQKRDAEAIEKANANRLIADKERDAKEKAASAPVRHSSPQSVPRNPERELEFQRYFEIHRKLKGLRKFMTKQAKQDTSLKTRMGDMRRTIRKCVGQLTGGKDANRAPLIEITTILKEAAATKHPQVPVSPFLYQSVSLHPRPNCPALLIYLLNIFAKAVIAQFIDEAGVTPRAADPVGIIASQIFSMNEFRWHGHSLIDILIAKFHVVCPILWGRYGDERTAAGKRAIGWGKQGDGFIGEQRNSERMTGLGAGFAAIALRSYDKARLPNPYPIHHYWAAIAFIVNTPPKETQSTHFIVLKAMIEYNEGRILELFGDTGKGALKTALVEFPRESEKFHSMGAKSLTVLADVLRRDRKLFL